MGNGKRVKEKSKKNSSKHAKEVKFVGLRMFGIILVILLTIFVILSLRKFYILNTYAVAMEEYSKKDNYTLSIDNNQGTKNTVYYKDGKTVYVLKPTETRQMYNYQDGNESILKIDSDGNKVAIISKYDLLPTAPRIISAFGEKMTVKQNFLLSLITMITEEDCNGKDCYKISVQGMKVWIDKETYLTVRICNGYSVSSDGTKTPLETNYEYEFGTVTDEQVAKPDLTGYKIQEQ